MTVPTQGGPSVDHLLDDEETAFLSAEGMKSRAVAIITAMFLRGWLAEASLALRALAALRRHDAWPESAVLVPLLDTACAGVDPGDGDSYSPRQDVLEAALLHAARDGVDEARFRAWVREARLRTAHARTLCEALPPHLGAVLAFEQLARGGHFPDVDAARVLGGSGRYDLLRELAEHAKPDDRGPGVAVAFALDAQSTPNAELGRACAALRIGSVFDGARLVSGELSFLSGIDAHDWSAVSDALTRRVAELAPDVLGELVRGNTSEELARGFVPHLRGQPALLEWLDSVSRYRHFDELVLIATGPVEPEPGATALPFEAYADSRSRLLVTLDREAPALVALLAEIDARPAFRLLAQLQRRGGPALARALVERLFTPEDLGHLLVRSVAEGRAMHPELLARVPDEAFEPVFRALRGTRLDLAREWVESLPRPEAAWRACASAAPTPELRGLARHHLAVRGLERPPPVGPEDVACLFGHLPPGDAVPPGLVEEARLLLSDAFVENPAPIEFWDSLVRVVLDSGDADLRERLRRVWLVLLDRGTGDLAALSGAFIETLDPERDRRRLLAALTTFHGYTGRWAEDLVSQLPPAVVTLAARSAKTPDAVRAAAVALEVGKPDFDEGQLDLSGAPGVLLALLDSYRAHERATLTRFALERTLHAIVDEPLDQKAEDEATTLLRELRERIQRYRIDPEVRRDVLRKRLRHSLLKVTYRKGKLTVPLEHVEAWLRAAAWVRDWPDGRLARDVEALAEKLDPGEKASLHAALTLSRAELAQPPLEPAEELALVLRSLVLRRKGVAP